MKKWLYWNEVIARWEIKDFELFDLMKKGLQAYTEHGKKVIDPDTLEHAPRRTLKQIETDIRAKIVAGGLPGGPGSHIPPRPTEAQIKYRAKMAYKSEPLEPVNPPKDAILMRFTLPDNFSKAQKVILKAKAFSFKKDDVLKFEKKLGLGRTDRIKAEKEKQEEAFFPCPPGTKWEDIEMTLVSKDTMMIIAPHAKDLFTYHHLELSDKRSAEKPSKLWTILRLFAAYNGRLDHGIEEAVKRRLWANRIEYDKHLTELTRRLNRHMKKLFGINDSIFKYHFKKHKAYITKIIFKNKTDNAQSNQSADNLEQSLFESELEEKKDKLGLPRKSYFDG